MAGITEVVCGGASLSAAATAGFICQMTDSATAAIDEELLERDVVLAEASGLDNQMVAPQMSVSSFTVKTHAVRATTKVGARDGAQVVTFTSRAGL